MSQSLTPYSDRKTGRTDRNDPETNRNSQAGGMFLDAAKVMDFMAELYKAPRAVTGGSAQ